VSTILSVAQQVLLPNVSVIFVTIHQRCYRLSKQFLNRIFAHKAVLRKAMQIKVSYIIHLTK
jgi:hypothetical protein